MRYGYHYGTKPRELTLCGSTAHLEVPGARFGHPYGYEPMWRSALLRCYRRDSPGLEHVGPGCFSGENTRRIWTALPLLLAEVPLSKCVVSQLAAREEAGFQQ